MPVRTGSRSRAKPLNEINDINGLHVMTPSTATMTNSVEQMDTAVYFVPEGVPIKVTYPNSKY